MMAACGCEYCEYLRTTPPKPAEEPIDVSQLSMEEIINMAAEKLAAKQEKKAE